MADEPLELTMARTENHESTLAMKAIKRAYLKLSDSDVSGVLDEVGDRVAGHIFSELRATGWVICRLKQPERKPRHGRDTKRKR